MTIPGGYSANDVLTASDMNLLPAGLMGHSAATVDQTVSITGEVSVTGASVSFTAVTGRQYEVSCCINYYREFDNGLISIRAYVDSTLIYLAQDWVEPNAVTAQVQSTSFTAPFTTTSGSRTVALKFEHSGDETVIANTFGRGAYVLVKDIGPA